ncbi:hypothetical protein BDW42DRAFT_66423 [Aspergillus taichungensis]|uniref:Transmembrane protein n=1 Tax=Aspergillus taichungensis TaxID=482145 RepID=A0A2J5I0B6_9EURO|nr:hypothetical protein BDW42DRAFT_66423 [Aspergillus taichungensis]
MMYILREKKRHENERKKEEEEEEWMNFGRILRHPLQPEAPNRTIVKSSFSFLFSCDFNFILLSLFLPFSSFAVLSPPLGFSWSSKCSTVQSSILGWS